MPKPLALLGPPPPASSLAVHNVMVANRGKDTGLERDLKRALRAAGLKGYRVNYRIGNTRVDVAFPRARLVLLLHGCFWHNCPVCRHPMPKTHHEFWARKFSLTRDRDARVRDKITSEGWKLLEIWEHDVTGALGVVTSKVAELVNRPLSGQP